MELVLDRAANQLVVNGRTMCGHRRWEAAVLAVLIEGGHASAATAAGSSQIDALLSHWGQAAPLTRKQWALIWQSLRSMFAAAGAEAAWSARLHHPPRGATVGPWWWASRPGDRIEIVGSPPMASALPLPRLTGDADARGAAGICERFLVAQGLLSDGQLQAASDALTDDAAWAGVTPETQALRLLRLGEVALLRRDFVRAWGAWRAAADTTATCDVAEAYLGGQVALLEHRIAYAQHPVADAARILARVSPLIRRPACARHLEVDTLSRGLTLNVAALCERRWIEQHAGREPSTTLMAHAGQALAYWMAALFGFLVSNQHEQVQNMCSNVGYLFQRQCELDIDASAESALRWYALAQAWHNRFDLPEGNVWEYIFLGDFWLARRDVRVLLDQPASLGTWAGRHPGQASFYEYAARRAREIGEPRQIAHTALNLWRFSRERGQLAAMRQALAHLERTLDAHPDLRVILTAEGYSLPGSGRRAAGPRPAQPRLPPHHAHPAGDAGAVA